MVDFSRYDTDENRQDLLITARKAALSALQQYNLEWECIRFIQCSDTITFKIETSTPQSYLLRIHTNRLSKMEIQSELLLLKALNTSDDLIVPEGLISSNGTSVLEIDNGLELPRLHVTLMDWVEGEHLAGEMTDNYAFAMGQLMGRLHEAADQFVPPPEFHRPEWGVESFKVNMDKLGRYYSCFLSDEGWESYQAAAAKILSELGFIHRSSNNYGLIHADLHAGNIVFKDGHPYPIDFGRCGYGYFLYDMAGALVGLRPEHRKRFVLGYESKKELESDYVRNLECFFIMFMIENYCHHASDPRETAGLIEEQPYAQAYIRSYLNDIPFLFEELSL